MTMFASAATPIVRIIPAKPGSVSVTLKSRIAAYRKSGVDAEADHRDEAEEAVEEEQEERDEEQADDRGAHRLAERVLAERRRDLRSRSSVLNSTGSAPVWSTSARSFASWSEPSPVIWAPFEPLIPSGYCSKSIDGNDRISRSRTIAKLLVEGFRIGSLAEPVKRKRPRSASSRVISWNLSPRRR